MAKKDKAVKAKKAKANGKAAAPEDVAAEIAQALGEHAPKTKGKGNAYLKALVYAVADEGKFTDEQYESLSQGAKDWLNKAEAVLKKDDEAEVPQPGAATADDEQEDDEQEEEQEDDEQEDEQEEEQEDDEQEDEQEDDDEEEQEVDEKKAKKAKKAKGKKGKGKAKASAKPVAKAKKSAKSAAAPAKANKSPAEIKAAVDYAKKFSDDGPCTQVRKVTEKYKNFARSDVLAVAEALKINRFTASRQYQIARSAAK